MNKTVRSLMAVLALSVGPAATVSFAQAAPVTVVMSAPLEVSDDVLQETEGELVPLILGTIVIGSAVITLGTWVVCEATKKC